MSTKNTLAAVLMDFRHKDTQPIKHKHLPPPAHKRTKCINKQLSEKAEVNGQIDTIAPLD